jgi:hypothetical protein
MAPARDIPAPHARRPEDASGGTPGAAGLGAGRDAAGSVRLSLVVVSWNTREVLRSCLASLRAHAPGDSEVVVVDNASSDGSPEMVAADFPEARLLRQPRNLGFGGGANVGLAAARGRVLALLNSDAWLLDASLEKLVARLEAEPDIGLIGPLILLPDGRVQASARRFPALGRLLLSELWLHRLLSRPAAARALLGHWFDHAAACDADWLVGACLLLPRATFARTGGFDARIFMYGEEVEWCRRIRASGLRVVFDPSARVRHLNHQSADRLFGDEGRVDRCLISEHQLLRRWHGWPASAAAHVVRLTGALLRLALFGLRRLARPGDAYARDVWADARALLAHYVRRLRGRTWRPA